MIDRIRGCFNKIGLDKRRAVIAGIISFLLSLAFVLGYQIENYSALKMSFMAVCAFLGIFILNTVLILLIYTGLDVASSKIGSAASLSEGSATAASSGSSEKSTSAGRLALESRLSSIGVFAISFAVIFILFSLSFLALYPGLFVFDASWQLDMFRSHRISEHQPVLHTLILGAIVERFKSDDWHINKGVAAYTIIQYTLAALAMAYAVKVIYKKTKSLLLMIISILFFALCPAIVLQVMSTTKDSYFLIAVVLLLTLCIEVYGAVLTPSKKSKSVLIEEANEETGGIDRSGKLRRNDRIVSGVKIAMMIISGTLAAIFRNNCIYAIPFLLVPMVIFFKDKRKTSIIISAGIILLFAIYKLAVVPAAIDEKVDGREFYSVPAQQLVRIYNDKNANVTEDEKEILEKLITSKGFEEYQPRIADKAKAALDMDYYKSHKGEIRKLYFALIRKNPKIAAEAFLELSCGMWYPGCRLTLFDDGRYGYWVVGCYPPAVMNSKIPALYRYYQLYNDSDFVTQNPITSLLFAPGTFFCLFAVMFGYAIDKKRKDFITVFIFILALWATYLLGPLAMVRYSIYLYGMVPLYFMLLVKPHKT